LFPIDLMSDEPTLVRFLQRLSSFGRHIWFDPRGRGASDAVPHDEENFGENGADDMLALVDHLGLEQVAVMGFTAGPRILFAASHTERTRALVLYSPSACLSEAPGHPEGFPAEGQRRFWAALPQMWRDGPAVGRAGAQRRR
jgi:pimeloyl-ACP methyl ester carboxylesterase